MHRAILLVVALLTWSRTSYAQYGEWKKIHEVKSSDGWLGAVWAESETRWVAGGKNLLIDTLNDGKVRVTQLSNLAVMDIAETRNGLLAVGSRGGIWSIKPQGIRMEAGAEPPAPKRGRDRDLLMRVGDASVGGADATLAVGADNHKIFDRKSHAWVSVSDASLMRELNEDVFSTKSFPAPVNCGPRTWLPFSGIFQKGVLLCGRKQLLMIAGGTAKALPDLPEGCGLPGSAAEFDGGRVALLCDGKTNLVLLAGGKWTALPTPQKFRFISVTKSCLFATVSNSVWRACMAEETPAVPATTKNSSSTTIPPQPPMAPQTSPAGRRPGGCSFGF